MARLILVLALIAVVWLILRRVLGASRQAKRGRDAPAFEKTVRCARCNQYTPISHAEREGDAYICREHRHEHSSRA